MKVILLKKVKKIGSEGEVTQVKDGYARNYLIPQGLALQATDDNLKSFQKTREMSLKTKERLVVKAQELKAALERISITITAQAKDDDEIYGAIHEAQILKGLKQEGIDLDEKRVVLEEPIKKLGAYTCKVMLHPDVEAKLRVWVVKQ